MRSQVGIGPQKLSYIFLNEIMDHSYSDGGPRSDKIECTKFFEACTKGSKVCSEVGMGPQSFSYGFLNEIMNHPCSDGGLGSDRIGCTKLNDGCNKYCEGCTKCSE